MKEEEKKYMMKQNILIIKNNNNNKKLSVYTCDIERKRNKLFSFYVFVIIN